MKRLPTIEDLELTDTDHEVFKKYSFKKRLGKGGFGRVFEAVRLKDSRPVAIKVGSKSDASQARIKAMLREADFLSNLHHPNIIKFYDIMESERNIYLVMELAKGGDVRA